MKLLLYCTKAKPYLTRNDLPNEKGEFYKHWQLGGELDKKHLYGDTPILNGKIVAECDFEVEEIRKGWGCLNGTRYFRISEKHYYPDFELEEHSCLSFDEMNNYLKGTLNEMSGYAIHIKNLHIFDEPKELKEYYTNRIYTKIEDVYTDEIQTSGSEWVRPIKKAPQNMMYAKETIPFKKELSIKGVLKELRGFKINEYVIISIKSEWLCKILNGEKTIEVRKVVLKEMLENEITR